MLIPENIEFSPVCTAHTIEQNVSLSVARFDAIHPIVSGNKLYKLYYFLQRARQAHLHLATFGGAYSNHLVATAYACAKENIACTGYVRGSEPELWSHTLQACYDYGMKLRFLPGEVYKEHCYQFLQTEGAIQVPEGGYHKIGANGAGLMMEAINKGDFTHVVCSAGSATMLAGLLTNNPKKMAIIVSPAIKNMQDIPDRLLYLTGNANWPELTVWPDYHFGGFAKKSDALLSFMRNFYEETNIPTDIVYTGKLMYGLMQKISEGYFPKGSKIVCIQSGGLQGNASLPEGSLQY